MTVHPHACGEHQTPDGKADANDGSPPRMWGTLNDAVCSVVKVRFTPTHVGNTSAASGEQMVTAVHPHACGEHGHSIWQTLPAVGSPPRMWGTPDLPLTPDEGGRFTPTHVGNTSCDLVLCPAISVHPHACGEHLARAASSASQTGSPPRMWGTPKHLTEAGSRQRFTPTHVGNTCCRE